VFEFCLNALRLREGFDAAVVRIAHRPAVVGDRRIRRGRRGQGPARSRDGWRWVPTELGARFLNDLQAIFCPERPALSAMSSAGLASSARIG